jgi:hypothetical protein
MYQQLQRSTQQRYAMQERVGQPPTYQNLGAGEDELSLSGVIMPVFNGAGSNISLDALRVMQSKGYSYHLILISLMGLVGDLRGKWFIHGIDESQSELFEAAAQKIEFTIKLKRDWS